MIEILFTLTTVYIAYVVYSIVNESKPSTRNEVVTPIAAETERAPAGVVETLIPEAMEEKILITPVVKPAQVAKAKSAAKNKPVVAIKNGNVRDPNTGELATASNNYRFIKRWIKEALVAEGLLEKVYKNNELDMETEALIKAAMATFMAMEKYRA